MEATDADYDRSQLLTLLRHDDSHFHSCGKGVDYEFSQWFTIINFCVGCHSSFIQRHNKSAYIRARKESNGEIHLAIARNCRVIRADVPDNPFFAWQRPRNYRESYLTDVLHSCVSCRMGPNPYLLIQRVENSSWLRDKQRLYDLQQPIDVDHVSLAKVSLRFRQADEHF